MIAATNAAEIIVIARHDSPLAPLTRKECERLWLGQISSIRGIPVEVADQTSHSNAAIYFYRVVAHLEQDELRSLRAENIYARGLFPPELLANDEAVYQWVKRSPFHIGYVSGPLKSKSYKILFTISEAMQAKINSGTE